MNEGATSPPPPTDFENIFAIRIMSYPVVCCQSPKKKQTTTKWIEERLTWTTSHYTSTPILTWTITLSHHHQMIKNVILYSEKLGLCSSACPPPRCVADVM